MIIYKVKKLGKEEMKNLNTSKYYKEINIYENIRLNRLFINRKLIFPCSATLKITSLKLIDTKEGESYEGEKLSGKKIVISGYVNVEFCVIFNNGYRYTQGSIPMSMFIAVPKDTTEDNVMKIYYSVEDLSVINVSYNLIFVSVTLCLEYRKGKNRKLGQEE